MLLRSGAGDHGLRRQLRDRLPRGVEHDGVEIAVLFFDGDHAVGRRAVVVDAVPGAQHLLVMPDLHHQVAGDHDVALLPGVARQLDIPVLGFLAVGAVHIERLRDAVQERRCQVVVLHPVGLVDSLALAGSRHGVGTERGADALDDVGDVYAERQGAAIDKGEVEVLFPSFARQILFDGDAGLLRHLCRSESCDLSELPDTERHFPDLEIQSRNTVHGLSSFPKG